MTYLSGRSSDHRRVDVITVVVLLFLGAVASGLSREQQNQIEAVVRATALWPFLELHRASTERTRVQQRARELTAERDSLVDIVTRYRILADQGRQLRAEAGLETLQLGSFLSAEVFPGRPLVGDPDVFVLRGEGIADLELPVGVFTGRGLVGVAREAYGTGVRGEFWSHVDFRVSVMTEDGAVSGILQPDRSQSEQPVLLLEGAAFQTDIAPGTQLLTTGVAGVYPRGVVVGSVREEAPGEAGWMKRYVVEPAVRPTEAGIVLVWVRPELPDIPIDFYLTPAPLPSPDSIGASP